MMNSKLKGFTLLETLVVMVVMLVVIASVFSVFLLVNNYFKKYQFEKRGSLELVSFDRVFEREMFYADSVMLNEEQHICLYLNERKINYILLDSTIVRSEIGIDTFKITVLNKSFEYVHPQQFLIEKLLLKMKVNKDTISAIYTKRYAADTYLKYAIRN